MSESEYRYMIYNDMKKEHQYINWYGHRMQLPINYCPMCRKKVRRLNGRKIL